MLQVGIAELGSCQTSPIYRELSREQSSPTSVYTVGGGKPLRRDNCKITQLCEVQITLRERSKQRLRGD